jgi:hypothetical protein
VKVVVVDRGQVVKDIKCILARFIYLFGVADHREVPLDVVKNRMTIESAGRAKNLNSLWYRLQMRTSRIVNGTVTNIVQKELKGSLNPT